LIFFGRSGGRGRDGGWSGRRRGSRSGCWCGSAQVDATFATSGLNLAGDFALGDPGHHLGVGLRRFGPEIAVIRSQITKVLGNRFHRVKGVFKPLKGA